MATGDAPVMEALIEINAASLARTELDARSLMLVRLQTLKGQGLGLRAVRVRG